MDYATPAELAAYIAPDAITPTPPPLASVLLRSASRLVRGMIAGAVYRVDVNELPVLPLLRDALRDATCEQASAWAANGIDPRPGAAGLKPIVTTKSLDGMAVSYGQSAAIQAATVALAGGVTLTDAAWQILDNVGLISNRVATL